MKTPQVQLLLAFSFSLVSCNQNSNINPKEVEELINKDANTRIAVVAGNLSGSRFGSVACSSKTVGSPLRTKSEYSSNCSLSFTVVEDKAVWVKSGSERVTQEELQFNVVVPVTFYYDIQGNYSHEKIGEDDRDTARKKSRDAALANGEQRELKAKGFANEIAWQIWNKISGGDGRVLVVTKWEFNSVAKKYLIGIKLTFYGSINRNNYYHVEGDLVVNENGNSPQFTPTYRNENFTIADNLYKSIEYLNTIAILAIRMSL